VLLNFFLLNRDFHREQPSPVWRLLLIASIQQGPKVMIKAKLALAVVIVLSSTLVAAAQARYHYRGRYHYYDRYLAGPGSLHSSGAPPLFSENPADSGGGSLGYNENMRIDDW
jgi:hypothetical protein